MIGANNDGATSGESRIDFIDHHGDMFVDVGGDGGDENEHDDGDDDDFDDDEFKHDDDGDSKSWSGPCGADFYVGGDIDKISSSRMMAILL